MADQSPDAVPAMVGGGAAGDDPGGGDGSPALKPVDADGVAAAVTGTIAWVVGGLVLWLGFGTRLAATGASWWLWVCAVGAGLGLIGVAYALRRRSVYRSYSLRTSAGTHEGQSPS